jgi:hypothetical protein
MGLISGIIQRYILLVPLDHVVVAITLLLLLKILSVLMAVPTLLVFVVLPFRADIELRPKDFKQSLVLNLELPVRVPVVEADIAVSADVGHH